LVNIYTNHEEGSWTVHLDFLKSILYNTKVNI
jgi:hypothetical protein